MGSRPMKKNPSYLEDKISEVITDHHNHSYFIFGSFVMQEKSNNPLVTGLDYMVDALKLPNEALRSFMGFTTCVISWRCPYGAQNLILLANSGRLWSIAIFKRSVVDSRDLNVVLGHTEAIHVK
ncbi:hypothetical protein TNCV_4884741 [Trichonephila clavipes]|nr:hypothetical protein TNCV_4884741 [Trichonephila clavipes]